MVMNPLDAFFRRFDSAAAAKEPKNDEGAPLAAGGPGDPPSDGGGPMIPDVRRFWDKIQYDAAAAGGGGSGRRRGGVDVGESGWGGDEQRLTKVQQDDLESLLQRYSLDNDDDECGGAGGAPPVPQSAEEANGNEKLVGEDLKNGKGSSSPAENAGEEGEGCCGCCSSLTYWERLLGCLVFFTGGYVLEMGSLRRFMWLVEGDPLPFVALWTLGHVVSICGSLFMVGPKQQCKNMFIPVRAPATTAYLACLGLTLTIVIGCVVLNRSTGLVLGIVLVMLLFVQCLCILWYTASCIPYLREYLSKKMFGDKYIQQRDDENIIVKDEKQSDGDKQSGGGRMFDFWRRKRRDYEEIPS